MYDIRRSTTYTPTRPHRAPATVPAAIPFRKKAKCHGSVRVRIRRSPARPDPRPRERGLTDRNAFVVERVEQVEDVVACHDVHPGGRLVEQKQVRAAK